MDPILEIVRRRDIPVIEDACQVPRRGAVRARLAEKGIGTEVYYPVSLHLQDCFAELGYGPGDLPEAERAAREVLALPIYAELSEEQQRAVARAIGGFLL